jgi:hypothetical protein
VINLISREPSSPLDLNVAVAGGSLGMLDTRFDGGFKRDRTFGIFSVERHEHDGFDLTPGTFDTTGLHTAAMTRWPSCSISSHHRSRSEGS